MVLCTWKNEEVDFMDSNLQRRFLRLLPCPPPSCSARCLILFRVQNSFMAKFCKATYELHCLVYCWKKVDAKNLWSLELAGGSWSKGENKFCPPLGPKKLFLFLYIFPCPENRVDHFCLLALYTIWMNVECPMLQFSSDILPFANLDDELRGP